MQLSATKLFTDNAIIRFSARVWRNKSESADEENPNKGKWYRYVDKEELKETEKIVRNIRHYLGAVVGTNFDWGPGLYIVRKRLLKDVLLKLTLFEYEFKDSVLDFLEKYPVALSRSLAEGKITQEEFDTAPQIGQLESKFELLYTSFVVWLPEDVEDDKLASDIRSQFLGSLENSFGSVRERLRVEFEDVLAKFYIPLLDPDRKRLHKSTMENLYTWMDSFKDRDILVDTTLGSAVTRLREMLDGVSMDDLKSDSDRRTVVGISAKALCNEIRDAAPPSRTLIL